MTQDEIDDATVGIREELLELIDGQPAVAVAVAMGQALGSTIEDTGALKYCLSLLCGTSAQTREEMPDPNMLTVTFH